MANFTGRQKADLADAIAGKLTGFKGSTLAQLQDTIGDSFTASNGNDTIFSGSGNDSINAGKGNDSIKGGAGIDTIIGDAGNDWISGGSGQDSINAGGNDDTIALFQGDEADNVDGGAGIDLLNLSGLTLNTSIVDLDANTWSTSAAAGNKTVSNIENVTGGGAADTLIGNAASNALTGNGGDDTLTGDAGADTLNGGAGDDQLAGGAGADSITGGAGNDTVFLLQGEFGDTINAGGDRDLLDLTGLVTAVATVDLGAGTWSTSVNATAGTISGVEDVKGSGLADTLRGDAGANSFSGGNGGDVLQGRGGFDTISGGAGNDVIVLNEGDEADDVDGGNGTDHLNLGGLQSDVANVNLSSGKWSTTENAAVLDIVGVENITGGDANDRLIGNTLDNVLSGGVGADTISGEAGVDTLNGGDGNDALLVNLGDIVAGDEMNGGAGLDRLVLGSQASANLALDIRTALLSGMERFEFSEFADIVKSVKVGASQVTELASVDGNLGASDQLRIVTGAATLVNLAALTFADWDAAGTDKDRVYIVGDASAERLTGSSQIDIIMAGGGNDVLTGGLGKDVLKGGFGNDIYFVTAKQEAVEKAGQGIDTVKSLVTMSIGANLEHLTLIGTVNANATGNSLANRITGNSGGNILNGQLGSDTLAGGLGNDTYIFGKGDKIVEKLAQGIDTIKSAVSTGLASNVEKLVLTGTGNINGTGNGLANTLTGNAGANSLNGLAGNDTLVGGKGADKFVFTSVLNASSNVDAIKDFNTTADHLTLENGIFKGLAAGKLAASAFHIGTSAGDLNDHIIYNAATGALSYDADGKGGLAQVKFAQLATHLALNAGDFLVI